MIALKKVAEPMKQINESFKKWRYSSLLYLFFKPEIMTHLIVGERTEMKSKLQSSKWTEDQNESTEEEEMRHGGLMWWSQLW